MPPSPRVVDHHVRPTELVGRVEERRHLRLVGDVAHQLADPVGAELRGQRRLPASASRRSWVSLRTTAFAPSSSARRNDGRADAGARAGRHRDDLAAGRCPGIVVGAVIRGLLVAEHRSARMLRCTSSPPP